MQLYCGNNAAYLGLQQGTHRIGTSYECFRKGIANGLSLPVDEQFLQPYQPINKERVYCGKEEDLPSDYDRRGGLHECYLKGVGVGKRKKAVSESEKIPRSICKSVTCWMKKMLGRSRRSTRSPARKKKTAKKSRKNPKKSGRSKKSKKSRKSRKIRSRR